jgi:hypothetical protein
MIATGWADPWHFAVPLKYIIVCKQYFGLTSYVKSQRMEWNNDAKNVNIMVGFGTA